MRRKTDKDRRYEKCGNTKVKTHVTLVPGMELVIVKCDLRDTNWSLKENLSGN